MKRQIAGACLICLGGLLQSVCVAQEEASSASKIENTSPPAIPGPGNPAPVAIQAKKTRINKKELDYIKFVLEQGVLKGVYTDHLDGNFYVVLPVSEAKKLKEKAPAPGLYIKAAPNLTEKEAIKEWKEDPQRVVVKLKALAVKLPAEGENVRVAIYYVRSFKFKTRVP